MNDIARILSTFSKLDTGTNMLVKEAEVVDERDEGKPGKNFAKIAKDAGERYGSKEAGERVAGAVRAKLAKAGKLDEEGFEDFGDEHEDHEEKDSGEYDQEGDMAQGQLDTIKHHIEELEQLLGPDDNLPEWVQSKITLATDYIQTVSDYMKSQNKDHEEESGSEEFGSEEDDLDECYATAMGPTTPEAESGLSVSTNQDTKTGRKSVTVTADGESADDLMKLLAMAGMGRKEAMDEEYANEPNPDVADAETQMNTLSGGLGKQQTMHKHGYKHGDNPLAMHEEISKMAERLQSKFKTI